VEIEIGINPNCSEATMNIKLDDQKELMISKLKNKLSLELSDGNYEPPKKKQKEWDTEDEPEEKQEFDWSEGYWNDTHVFGIRILRITGDAPYNFGEEIERVVKRYLPEAEIEWTEP
jgi:hypothetical protein